MPFAYDSKKTLVVKDYNTNDGKNWEHWTEVTLSLEFSSDKTTLNWKMNIQNEENHNHKSEIHLFYKDSTDHLIHQGDYKMVNDNTTYSGSIACPSSNTTWSPKFTLYVSCYGIGTPGRSPLKASNEQRVTSGEVTINRIYYTDAALSYPTITDNNNNSYTIKYYVGTAGTNNKIIKNNLTYYDASTAKTVSTDYTASGSKTVSFTPNVGAADSIKITASATTTSTYNSAITCSSSANIKQYPAPGDVESLEILANGSSGKYVITKPVTVQWNNVTKTNNNMTIDSYRVYFVKNGTDINVNGKKITANGSAITGVTDSANTSLHYFTVPKSSGNPNSIEFNPKDFGLVKDDTFSIRIHTHSTSTKVDKFSTGKSFGPVTFVNAGIVHMYDGSTWKEGQVFVYDGSTWKEAEVVSVYDGSAWQEAT